MTVLLYLLFGTLTALFIARFNIKAFILSILFWPYIWFMLFKALVEVAINTEETYKGID